MFCSKCGNEIHQDIRFCPKCGNALGQVPSQVNPVQPQPQVNPAMPNAYNQGQVPPQARPTQGYQQGPYVQGQVPPQGPYMYAQAPVPGTPVLNQRMIQPGPAPMQMQGQPYQYKTPEQIQAEAKAARKLEKKRNRVSPWKVWAIVLLIPADILGVLVIIVAVLVDKIIK